jgi:hypothetical protein
MRFFSEFGYGFTLQCGGNGNYITLQRLDDEALCVDKDGFAYARAEYNPNSESYSCPSGVLPSP